MNPIAELIIVWYNDRKNAYEGDRNLFQVVQVVDKVQIKDEILIAFNKTLAKRRGCVVVKYDGKIWLCERDTVNPKKVYTRHEITYHPLMDKFTI